MADWGDNLGSCQDLSHLAENSITATSQAGGNMMSSNATAMTAPGSQPVTPLPPMRNQDTPNMTMTSEIGPGTSGKPQASGQAHRPDPGPPAWGKTETPDVHRIPAPVPPDVTADDSSESPSDVHPGTRLSTNYGTPLASGAGSAAE